MDVRMITQVASPGLQHGQATDLSAEIFVVPTNIGQGGGALTQQQRVKDFLVGADDFAQLGWDGESDHIVRHRQQTRALALKPLGGIGVAALRTGAMVAGVIGIMLLAARAPVELSAQCRRAAGEDSSHGAPMRRQQARAILPLIRRPVPAQDFGQWDHEPPERLRLECLVEAGQGHLGAGFANVGQVGVDDGGIERLMTQVGADLA